MHTQREPDYQTTLKALGWSRFTTPDQLRLMQACPYLFAVDRSLRNDRSLSIGPGWMGFFTQACLEIEALIQEMPDEEDRRKIYAVQAKEKLGGLRVYMRGSTKEISNVIHVAERESYKTCEKCGNRGEMAYATSGWMATLCRDSKCRPPSKYPLPPPGRIEDECQHDVEMEDG